MKVAAIFRSVQDASSDHSECTCAAALTCRRPSARARNVTADFPAITGLTRLSPGRTCARTVAQVSAARTPASPRAVVVPAITAPHGENAADCRGPRRASAGPGQFRDGRSPGQGDAR